MAVGYAAWALHAEHVRPCTRRALQVLRVFSLGVPCILAACQSRLGSFVGRNQGLDASPRAAVSDGGVPSGLDAGGDGGISAGDASTSGAVGGSFDGGDAGGAGPDGAVRTSDAASRWSQDAALDAGARGDGGRDASTENSQAWPLGDSRDAGKGDAGGSVATGTGAAVVIDGDISEWPRGIWTELSHRLDFAEAATTELAAACAWQMSDDELFLAVVVRDDVHHNEHGGFDIWKGDSLQVAFDVGQSRLPYDWEYGVALIDGELEVHRWLSSDAALGKTFPAAVVRWGDITVYELRFVSARLGVTSFEEALVRASVAINESDGYERTAALELAPGIVEPEKSKAEFVTLTW
jgi:hypothetical protein